VIAGATGACPPPPHTSPAGQSEVVSPAGCTTSVTSWLLVKVPAVAVSAGVNVPSFEESTVLRIAELPH
jgi:hypothetical protein